jgi:hypothetical protein
MIANEASQDDVRYFDVEYRIRNNGDKKFRDMKLYIYLYQIYDENVIYNSQLKEEIFYEGSLQKSFMLKEHESVKFNLKLYPLEGEEVSTTCLVVDSAGQVIYMSPISKVLILN